MLRVFLVFACLIVTVAAQPAPPQIAKVEPPDWWPGHSINPVRLLIRGRHLRGAAIEPTGAGLTVTGVRANDQGTYVLADVLIDPAATPGPRTLRLRTSAGVAEAAFTVLAPLAREGRFQGFSQDDVIYSVMPDRFANGDPGNDDLPPGSGMLDRQKARHYHGGDLQGLLNRLPYLKDLGVTALWIKPVYDNVNHPNALQAVGGQAITDYHGYGAIDFYAVDEHLGDLAKFRELVDAAHRLGVKVIQDQVANHTGPYHHWVDDPPTPTWLNGTMKSHLANRWQTHLLMDPHATPAMQRETLEGWFVNILPDLNQEDPEVSRYLIQNSLWWVGRAGLDGVRQDTLPYVPRRYWRDWMDAVKREYPSLTVVGEVLDGSAPLVSFFQGGATRFDNIDTRIDTLFDYPLYFQMRRAFAQGKAVGDVVSVLHQDYLYPAPDRLVTLVGSHDVARFMHEAGATRDGLKLAATFLFTARGTPVWYYGDEIAMPGGPDPDNRRDFPGGWPGDSRSAFDERGRTPEEQDVFAHVRRLMRLRRDLAPLRRGRMVHLSIGDETYAFARVTNSASVIVGLNNGMEPSAIECDVSPLRVVDGATFRDALGGTLDVKATGGRIRMTLAARSAVVLAPR